MSSVLSRIQIIMEANTANYNNELRRAQQNSGKSFDKIKKAAGKMALGVGAAIVGMGAKAIHTAGNFEEAMNAISAVSGATGKDFDDLRERAKQLGSETAYSATEAANGMEFLAKAGLNTTQILDTIPNALALASAGSIDLAQSADILSNIMSGMGIAAEDSGRAADVLAKAAASSNVDVSMLGESMKYVAPIAKQLGVSLEETSAIIGVLGNAGIQASQAGTSLRAMFTRFNTHKAANEAFKELGVSLTDGNGQMRSMIDVMKDLSVATESLDPAKKLDYFKDMAGVEAMSALAVAVDAAADGSLQNLTETLKGAKGAAEEMAAVRMEGFKGSIKGLMSAIEGLQIAFADSGLLDIATGAITVFANKVRELTQALPGITANITAFFDSAKIGSVLEATIDGLVMVWGNLVSVIKRTAEIIAPVINFFREHEELSKSLAIAIGIVAGAILTYNAAIVVGAAATVAFGTAIAFITAPLTLAVVGITALVAAGVYLYRNWDDIKAKAVEVWGAIGAFIGDTIDSIKTYFATQFPAMTAIVSGAINTIKTLFKGGFALIKNTVMTVMDVVKAVIDGDFKAIPGIISSGLKTAIGIVKLMMDNILNIVKNTGAKLYQVGKDLVQGLINGIKSGVSGVTSAISDMASSAVAKAKSVLDIRSPSRVMGKIGEQTAEGMANGIKKRAKTVRTEAQKMAEGAVKAVQDGIASLEKEIALFGDKSRLAEFEFDVKIGKYKGASNRDIQHYRQLLIQLMAVQDAAAKLEETEQKRLDVMRVMSGYSKAISDLVVPFTTELRDLNIELDNVDGKFYDLADEIKDGMRESAAMLDKAQMLDKVRNITRGIDRELALFGNNSLFAEWLYDLNDSANKLSLMDDERKQQILNKAKELDFANDLKRSQDALSSVMNELIQESPIDKIEADYERRIETIRKHEKLTTGVIGSETEKRLAIEQSYMDAKRNLLLTQGESLFSGLSGLAKSFAGEQSGIYRALFAVEKGFAIAQSAIAIQQSIAKAMAIGFPANIPVIGQAVSQGAGILSSIKSVVMPVGQAHDGIANVPREGTWILDKNERVVKADDNRKLSDFLDGKNKNVESGNINVNVTVSMDGNSNVESNSAYGKQIGQGLAAVVVSEVNKMTRPNGTLDRLYAKR